MIADSEEEEDQLLAPSQGLQGADLEEEEDGSGSDGDDGGSGSGSGSDSESDEEEDDNEEASMKKVSGLLARTWRRHNRANPTGLAHLVLPSMQLSWPCMHACVAIGVCRRGRLARGRGGARARSSTRSGAAPSCGR